MGKKYDAVILDVDGTLWDSTPVVAKAWESAIRDSLSMDRPVTPDELKGHFGKPMDVIARDMLPELDEDSRQLIMEKCCEYEQKALEENTTDLCYPLVRETIIEISKSIPVCIVSNCQAGYIELFMEKNGLTDHITDTLCFGDNGEVKTDNIRILATRNGYRSPVYVGDTAGDLASCIEAGVPMIWASYGFGDVEKDRIAGELTGFGDLPALLLS